LEENFKKILGRHFTCIFHISKDGQTRWLDRWIHLLDRLSDTIRTRQITDEHFLGLYGYPSKLQLNMKIAKICLGPLMYSRWTFSKCAKQSSTGSI